VHFKKALELDPGLAPNHEGLGLVYLAQGRAQDALTEIEREQMACGATRTGCRVLRTSSEEGVRHRFERVNCQITNRRMLS